MVIKFCGRRISILCWLYSFFIFLSMMTDSMLGSNTAFVSVAGKLMLLCRMMMLLFVVLEWFKNGVQKELFVKFLGFFAIVAAVYVFANSWMLFDLFFIPLFGCQHLNKDYFLKVMLWTFVTAILVIVLGYFVGIVPENGYNYISERTMMPRTTWGFHHPNALSQSILSVLFIVWLLYFKKHKWIVCGILCLGFCFVLIGPNTLTVCLSIALVIFFRILFELYIKLIGQTEKRKRFVRLALIAAIILITALGWLAVYTGKFDSIAVNLSRSVLSRIQLTRTGLERYGIGLFGTSEYASSTELEMYVTKTASEYFVIDCLYFFLPIRYGIVATAIFWIIFAKCMKRAIGNWDLEYLAVLCTLLISSLSESNISTFKLGFLFVVGCCVKLQSGGKYGQDKYKRRISSDAEAV